MSLQFITPYSVRLGVLGGGTMGSGIALAALLSDMQVTLYDVSPEMLEKSARYISQHLNRKNKAGTLKNLKLAAQMEDLNRAHIVIEAVPENLRLKQEVFAHLDTICSPATILATNTSTLPVTAIAAAVQQPQRVAGMHFFNPAAVMPLVEIVKAPQTSADTIQSLQLLAEHLGKTPIIARDTPGFIVNRVARPFYSEALRLLTEGIASHQAIDQIIRWGGDFRMGPFQLIDLIGIDINLAATKSMYEQTFGEPRYRPQHIQVQMVQQNRLGQKTGQGFYSYQNTSQSQDPILPQAEKRSGYVLITHGVWAPGIVELTRGSGYTPTNGVYYNPTRPIAAIVTAGRAEGLRKQMFELERDHPVDMPILCQCADTTLTEIASWIRHPERLVGFDGLFFASGKVVTLVSSPTLTPQAHAEVSDFVTSLGRLPIWIEDTPGLVLPRMISMLVNEAVFALMEQVADAETIDQAMQLGANFPYGPLAWAKMIGYDRILQVLGHLKAEYGEERYRAAQLLRRWAFIEQVAS